LFFAEPGLAAKRFLCLRNTREMNDHTLGPARGHRRLDLGRQPSAVDRSDHTETTDENSGEGGPKGAGK